MDDDALFNDALQGAKALKHKKRATHLPQPEIYVSDNPQSIQSLSSPPPLQAGTDYLAMDDTARLDGTTAKKIKNTQLPIEGKLDLHGVHANTAFEMLGRFIQESFHHKKHLLLIITGKGETPTRPIGILREAFPRWINSPAISPYIAYYTHPSDKHGGTGAFLVYLRHEK